MAITVNTTQALNDGGAVTPAAGTNRLGVWVFGAREIADTPQATLSSVALGATAFDDDAEQVSPEAGAAYSHSAIAWMLDANLAGDEQAAAVTWSEALNVEGIGDWLLFEGVDQVSPIRGTPSLKQGDLVNSLTSDALTVEAGDCVVCIYTHNVTTGTMTPPTGYTPIRNITGTFGLCSAYKLITESGTETPVFTTSGSNRCAAVFIVLRGASDGGSTETTVSPTTGSLTLVGQSATINAFDTITLRGTLVNEAGSPVADATGLSCLVWYGDLPAGAPDQSLSSLTTNSNGSYSFALALGGLSFGDPVYRVIVNDDSTRNHAGRRIPSYE